MINNSMGSGMGAGCRAAAGVGVWEQGPRHGIAVFTSLCAQAAAAGVIITVLDPPCYGA